MHGNLGIQVSFPIQVHNPNKITTNTIAKATFYTTLDCSSCNYAPSASVLFVVLM
uniref:Small nuclear ribonucleoprotein f n=1 Tax=Rhizophora mucronata TaxID=61149 RepID=A0A2P2JQ39_RHIMU